MSDYEPAELREWFFETVEQGQAEKEQEPGKRRPEVYAMMEWARDTIVELEKTKQVNQFHATQAQFVHMKLNGAGVPTKTPDKERGLTLWERLRTYKCRQGMMQDKII